MSTRTRYAIVGTGGRHEMYRDAILGEYRDQAQLVGLCDCNAGRLELSAQYCREQGGGEIPCFTDNAFDMMVQACKPEWVIVTSRDSTHDQYICRAMELGCDVITEKPMTIDAERCTRILDTQTRTGRRCRVTFNYRYSPARTQVKDLLMSGVIGDVRSVDFHWLLDIRHGADYFRRWHRNKENSGGLMVHKATHHFDLVNWWLSAVPTRVFASGQRRFYTPEMGDRHGLHQRGERCNGCPEAARCPFHLSLADNPGLRSLYLDQEKHDGYQRDQCVFSADIGIEDTMNVLVDYSTGARMSYSLNAFMPWEGYTVSFNGSKGRLEHKCEEGAYINADGSVPGALKAEGTWTRIYPHRAPAHGVDIWEGEGGHGGGDAPLLRDVFGPACGEDRYLRAADHRAGAYSILVGIAANESMARHQPVEIAGLTPPIPLPDYTEMPSAGEPLG